MKSSLKFLSTVAALGLIAMLSTNEACGGTISVNTTAPGSTALVVTSSGQSNGILNNRDFVQTFVVTSNFTVDAIYFQMQNFANAGTAQITMRLFTVADPLASTFVAGTALASDTFTIQAADVALPTGSASGPFYNVKWDLNDVALTSGQSYAVMWDDNGVLAGRLLTSTTDTYAPGTKYINTGSYILDVATPEAYLAFEAAAVPELSSSLVLLFSSLALFRRKR